MEFGCTHYENVAYFNFETHPELNETFEEDISPDYLIPILSHIARQTIIREKTLIVFDEVQLCERALVSLKYFCEDAPDYHIIVAGSLLGVAVNRTKYSFPVGKVDIKTMYPMDMEEFMYAMGEDALVEQIKASFASNTAQPAALHDTAMLRYRQYLIVGGMPECVTKFAQTKDYVLVRHTQDTILAGYLNDMSKYNNLNEIKKTRLVYDNITVQLSKKNTRFQYKLIKKEGGLRSLRMRSNGFVCPVSCRRSTGWNKSETPSKIIVILMHSRFMCQTWGSFAPRKIWLQTISSIW